MHNNVDKICNDRKSIKYEHKTIFFNLVRNKTILLFLKLLKTFLKNEVVLYYITS